MIAFKSIERLFIKCFVIEYETIMLVTEGEVSFFNSNLIEVSKVLIDQIDQCMDSFSCFNRDITVSGKGYLVACLTTNHYPLQFGSQYKGRNSSGKVAWLNQCVLNGQSIQCDDP